MMVGALLVFVADVEQSFFVEVFGHQLQAHGQAAAGSPQGMDIAGMPAWFAEMV